MKTFEEMRSEMENQFNRLTALGDYDASIASVRALTEAVLVAMIKIERLESAIHTQDVLEEKLSRRHLVDSDLK